MRALVVGYGSIGERHARILREEGCDVAVVSHRRVTGSLRRFGSIRAGVERHRPGYVVIASPTSEHAKHLLELARAEYTGATLVEKPLFDVPRDLPSHGFSHLFVGYNMRFHPGLRRFRTLIAGEHALSALVYAGQYLPDWRPGRDYRQVYSADKAAGGGVLLDLSHELDYLNWIFGGWTRVAALGGKLSSLEVSSNDTLAAILSFRDCCVVTLQLNYLDRLGRRSILLNTDDLTVELNLLTGCLSHASSSSESRTEQLRVERDDSYRSQHRAVLDGEHGDLCTGEEAQAVLLLIEAIEVAIAEQTWVAR